ncbi:MAG TPA: hypothetical protein VE291_10750, partial [Terracidiphilus sp.]|nr:hypothetical protein [Terracidiphilus sp.]
SLIHPPGADDRLSKPNPAIPRNTPKYFQTLLNRKSKNEPHQKMMGFVSSLGAANRLRPCCIQTWGTMNGMADVITGLRQVIQDLVAPDLKAIQVKQDALGRQSEVQHDAMMKTLEAFRAEMRSEFAALRANN